MTDFWAGREISCDWACHIKRGSLGGTDFPMPVGTPVPAAFTGTISNIPDNGTGGNTATLTRADGVKIQYLHLSKFVTPGHYNEGDTVGYSGGAAGAPGSGESTGPHLHIHAIVNGKRVDYRTVVGAAGSPTVTNASQTTTTNPIDALTSAGTALGWLTNSKNWVRIGLFCLGGILLLVAAIGLIRNTPVGDAVAETANKAVDGAKKTASAAVDAAVLAPK